MPIGVARWLVRSEIERISHDDGPAAALDLERAVQQLIDDAIRRDRAERGNGK
jgi:hypothetical protein